jgi:hypothetical protein
VQLVAGTFGVALALALGAASQRSVFERYVREKYPTADAASEQLASRIARGELSEGQLAGLTPASWRSLYQWWMQADRSPPEVPRALVATAPAVAVDRLERTFVAGTTAQRRRALAFAAAAGDPRLRSALELGRKAAARGPAPALAEEFQNVLDSLPPQALPLPLNPSVGDGGN